MQNGSQVRVRAGSSSNPALFTGALAQNVGLNVRVPLKEDLGAGRVSRGRIKAILITSVDNLLWDFWFWGNQQFQIPGNAQLEAFLGQAVGGASKQIAATGLFYTAITGLDIYYEDDDAGVTSVKPGSPEPAPAASCFLNVTLINRSAGAKTNGGWFDVTFIIEPTLGW